MRRHIGTLRCMAAAVSAVLALPVWAQQTPAPAAAPSDAKAEAKAERESGQIASVVVTATKRKEDASKVPISISVLRGEDLAASHIVDFGDLTRAIPNISYSGASGSGAGLSNIEMRGVSSLAGSATVGVYMDDVSMTTRNLYSLGSAEPKIFDVDRVEVLRGPQGTLYGASSMGGTIKFITNQPNTKQFEANFNSELSSTSGGGTNYMLNGVLNVPLRENDMALRIGLQTGHTSGYIDQVSPVDGHVIAKGINSENDQVARLALKWNINHDFSITPSVFYQEVETKDIDASYLSLSPNQTSKLIREPGTDRLLVPSLSMNYDLGQADLVSITSLFQRSFNRTQDGTSVNVPYIATLLDPSVTTSTTAPPGLAAAVGALPSAVYLNNQVRQISEELRVSSHPFDPKTQSSGWTWLGGFYYANLHTNVTDNEPVFGINAAFAKFNASPADPGTLGFAFPNDNSYFSVRHYALEQKALFGEVNYYFTPTLHATLGARYITATHSLARDGDLFYAGGPNHTFAGASESKFTPKISLSWEVDKDHTVYATAAQGFRLGGENRDIPASVCAADFTNLGITKTPTAFNSDSLWSYEIGDKAKLLGNRLTLNSSLFYIKWNSLQQDIQLPGCGYDYETNVGNAKSYGAEIELAAKPTSATLLKMSGGYTHAVLTSDVALGNYSAQSGDPIQGVPTYNATLTGQYNFDLPGDRYGFLRAAIHWVGSSHGTIVKTDPDYIRPSYVTADASVGVTLGDWDLSLFVKNLTNNDTIIQRPNVQSVEEGNRLVPRTIGVTLSAKM